jgi:hypothetical protein
LATALERAAATLGLVLLDRGKFFATEPNRGDKCQWRRILWAGVFLVSWMRGGREGATAQNAAGDGFRHSARVVTGARLSMIAVVSGSGFVAPQ